MDLQLFLLKTEKSDCKDGRNKAVLVQYTCIIKFVCERQREMCGTKIKDRMKKEKEGGSHRTIILGNWGVSALFCEMRCPTTGWFQAVN